MSSDNGNNKQVKVLGIQDVLAPLPEMEYLVEGLITVPSVTLLAGEPGAKKTWAMLSLSVAVAAGNEWIGRSVKQGTVLFLDLESGNQRLLLRTRDIVRGHQVDPEELYGLKLVTDVPFNIRTEGGEDRKLLKELVEHVQPTLIVIDALADLITGADENSVKEVQPAFMWLRTLAMDTNTAIIILHHTNKSGGYRGSTAMKGNVDNLIMVESGPKSSTILFRSEKLRDSEPVDFAAEITFRPGSVNLEPTDEDGDPFGTNAGAVLEAFKKYGDMTTKQAHSHVDDGVIRYEDVRYAIKYLLAAKKLARKDAGGKGSTATYGILSR